MEWLRGATLLLVLSGCVACGGLPLTDRALPSSDLTAEPLGKEHILVTFAQRGSSATPVSGSKRYYHLREEWGAPLHVRSDINRVKKVHGLTEVGGWPIKSLNMYCVVFRPPPTTDPAQLMVDLQQRPEVLIAQPLNEFHGLTASTHPGYDDPYIELQYGGQLEQLYTLHQYSEGANVKVGIIDSPIDEQHPDLRGQVKAQHNFVRAEAFQDQLHGTAVAGVIAAVGNNGKGGVGLAPAAALYSYGACKGGAGGLTTCNSFDLARAIEAALEDEVEILNLSLAGPEDPLIAALLDHGLARGMMVVASINDDNPGRSFPASMAGVIGVGKTGILPNRAIEGGSQSAGWILSQERLSTRAGGGYQYFYGSSIASAGVTGLAALIRSTTSASRTNRIMTQVAAGDCNGLDTGTSASFAVAVRSVIGCADADDALFSQRSTRSQDGVGE